MPVATAEVSLNCVGAAMLVSEAPGDLTSTCRCCKFKTYRLFSCPISLKKKKNLNQCVFGKLYGTVLWDLEALFEGILVPRPSVGEKKNPFENPIF